MSEDRFDEEPTDDGFYEQDGPGLFEPAEDADLQADGELSAERDVEPPDTSGVEGIGSDDDAPAELAPPPARPTRQVPETPEAPLALYRRYRPDTFADLIGQDHVTEPLQRALINNRVNHAYLFSGPRGCGKTTSARILARCLNCEQGPTPTPCGECESCRGLARGGSGSIDVIEIDAASHGGVDDARELREKAFFAPVSSRYKIYIVDEAHMVTSGGFNALLKVVEEPPPHVKFIFATTEPDKVIGTVRSRTHHYPFRLVPPRELTTYLAALCDAEKVDVDPAVLPLVVRAGAGSVRDSLSVLDQLLGGASEDGVGYEQAAALLGFTPDSLLDGIVDAFASGDGTQVFRAIDDVINNGQDPRRFAEDLLTRLRDLVIVAAVPGAVSSGLVVVSEDQAERMTTQASGMGLGELTRAAEVISRGLTEMRGTTAPRLYLELMCARVLLPAADAGDRGIHARLEKIERRLAMASTGVPAASGDDVPAAPVASGPAPQTQEHVEVSGDPRAAARAAARGGRPPAPEQPVDQRAAQPPAPAAEPARRQPEQSSQAPAADAAQRPRQDAPPETAPPPPADGTRQQRPAPQDHHERPAPQPDQDRRPPQVEQPGAAPEARPSRAPQPREQAPEGRPSQAPRPPGEAPSAPNPPSQAPQAAASGGSTPLSTAELRQVWPQVLEAVRRRRRFTWIMLSQNAQVTDVVNGVLTLSMANQGAREAWSRGGNEDILHEAVLEVIGASLRVEAIIDGAPATSAPAQVPPSAAVPSRPASRTPEPAAPERDEEFDANDPDADVPQVSSDELLRSQLGAEIIHDGQP